MTNVSGSFVLGLFMALILERFPPTRYLRPFVATGFLGAYTTYSTFAVESDLLVKQGHAAIGVGYAVGEPGGRLRRRVGGDLVAANRPVAAPRRHVMKLEGHQKRLTIFIGEADHHHHTPLATEIVHRAHKAGLAGSQRLSRRGGLRGLQPHPHHSYPVAVRRPAHRHRHR